MNTLQPRCSLLLPDSVSRAGKAIPTHRLHSDSISPAGKAIPTHGLHSDSISPAGKAIPTHGLQSKALTSGSHSLVQESPHFKRSGGFCFFFFSPLSTRTAGLGLGRADPAGPLFSLSFTCLEQPSSLLGGTCSNRTCLTISWSLLLISYRQPWCRGTRGSDLDRDQGKD